MPDYSKLNKIVLDPDSPFELARQLTVSLGRRFESPGDDFYGKAVFKVGDASVTAIAVRKDEKSAEMFIGGKAYTFQSNHSPFENDDNKIFSDMLWSGAEDVKKRATKEEVQGSRDYAIKALSYESVDDVPIFYSKANTDTRQFIMERIGSLQDSIDESKGRRASPKGIDEEWMHHRYTQTSSFLSEVFAFPDEVTREVFISSFLVRNGSCLLSGVPGTGKTVLTSIGCLLFMNGYGYSDFVYRPPVKDLATGKVKPFIYRDMNHRGDDKNSANILTVSPTKAELDDPERSWVFIPNIETTDQTEVEILATDIDAFISNNSLDPADIATLKSGNIRLGRYIGPTKTQNYSRNRTGEQLTDWNSQRFDQNLLKKDHGILMNDYYSRSLLRMTNVLDSKGNIDSVYVSDVLYDMARYPDTGERVMWVDEVIAERKFLKHETDLSELNVKRRSMTRNEDIDVADAEIAKIEAMQSNIHRKRDLAEDKWALAYGQGRKGKMSDAELEQINKGYIDLYESLEELVRSVDKTPINNARSENEILNEMLMDLGITTCSENKTPEDILYSMDISLVQDVDNIGRPVQQYVFKPTPLGFVTKSGKFLNEFSRADKDFQDQLLSLLDRGVVEYRGEMFQSPDFSLYCDNNPHKLLTSHIDWALWDRIDLEMYLKGASLGTKDMVLSRKFGREDVLMGKTEMKSNMQKEMLTRIRYAIDSLNDFKRSQTFRDTGYIEKVPGDTQGIIPMRIRETHQIWEYIDSVSIPRDILRYVFLLTTTMNQAWYLRKLVVNGTSDAGNWLEIANTEVVGQNFEPYGPPANIKPREAMLDYSMLSFATDFIEASSVISNIGIDKAKEQFPLGITRPVGMRFVESLLKYAKALAWFRRGHTQVTTKEIDDLFPLVGSHRLNVIPFGEDYEAGIDETIKQLYPNIQDYLRYGILGKYWLPRKDQYIQYYADLETVVNAGFLDVDSCAPSELDSRAGGVCKIRGNYSHSSLKSQEKTDIMILDIQNGVEFAKRNAPDYRRHYARRLEQITNIGMKNYYDKFIDDSEKFINDNDCNPSKIPMLLFRRDADELISRLHAMKNIFAPDAHVQTLTDMSTVSKIALRVIEGFKDYIEPASLPKLEKVRLDFEGFILVYNTIQSLQNTDDFTKLTADISRILKKTQTDISKMDKKDILKALNDKLDTANTSATGMKLKPYKFITEGKKKPLELGGEVNIVYNPSKAEQYISLIAKSYNDHLLWEYVRFSERLIMNESIEDKDRLA